MTGQSLGSPPVSVVLPAVRCRHSAAQSLPASGTDLTLAFDTEDFDTDGIHNTSTNNSRLTCQTPGDYHIYAHFVLTGAGDASKYWEARIVLNGTTNLSRTRGPFLGGSSAPAGEINTAYRLGAGDYVQLVMNQNNTATNNVQQIGSETPVFGMDFISA